MQNIIQIRKNWIFCNINCTRFLIVSHLIVEHCGYCAHTYVTLIHEDSHFTIYVAIVTLMELTEHISAISSRIYAPLLD